MKKKKKSPKTLLAQGVGGGGGADCDQHCWEAAGVLGDRLHQTTCWWDTPMSLGFPRAGKSIALQDSGHPEMQGPQMGIGGSRSFQECLSLALTSSTKNFSDLCLRGKAVIASMGCESERGNK